MKRLIKQAILGIGLAGVMATSATPAEAQWRRPYYGYHYRHRDDAGLILGLGLLAAGAAVAADRGYGYYGRPYYPGYYRPYRVGYWGARCFMRRGWDYWGRPVWMRVCR